MSGIWLQVIIDFLISNWTVIFLGGTFALYSLIARVAGLKVATNAAPEDHGVSSYQLLPKGSNRRLERAEKIKEFLQSSKLLQLVLLTIALFGTCCVIGDGVLTPAISGTSPCLSLKHPRISVVAFLLPL
jgi:KUP system potassium uptake protein